MCRTVLFTHVPLPCRVAGGRRSGRLHESARVGVTAIVRRVYSASNRVQRECRKPSNFSERATVFRENRPDTCHSLFRICVHVLGLGACSTLHVLCPSALDQSGHALIVWMLLHCSAQVQSIQRLSLLQFSPWLDATSIIESQYVDEH